MDELQALLDRIGGDEPPTDQELADARTQLVAELRAAVEGDTPNLEDGRVIRAAIDQIDGEQAARVEAAEAEAAELAALTEGLDAPTEDEDEDDGDEDEEEEVSEDEQVPVMASLAGRPRRTPVATSDGDELPAPVVASVGPAYESAAPASPADVARLFARHANGVQSKTRTTLVSASLPIEGARSLGADPWENTRRINAALQEGLTAAGGICPPTPALFDVPICGDRGRPIRDALLGFRADRGGIRFLPALSPAMEPGFTPDPDETGVGVWTLETDENPGETVKVCHRVDCDDEVECFVDAVYACLTIGNFQARFNPEQWAAALALLDINHDRAAEQILWETLTDATIAGVNALTLTPVDGTARTWLIGLRKAVTAIRYRQRRTARGGFRLIAPDFLRQGIISDFTRQQPGDDAVEIAEARLDGYLSSIGVSASWSVDVDETAMGDYTDPTFLGYPAAAEAVLFPEGSWLYLDGGELNLGTNIVDSTLISTNDRQAFKETFEKACFRGCESLVLTGPVDEECVCPPGVS